MLISRTPYRISFLGGGSDYPSWYQRHGGAVLSTSINHYCYITARPLPPFFPNKSRVVWSKIEDVATNSDIQHTSVRASLQYLGIDSGIELHHMGDLPARSGLGSSSSFTVGALNVLNAMQGHMVTKYELAHEAIHVERDLLKENVGIQDQIAAAYGGFNNVVIDRKGNFEVHEVSMSGKRRLELQDHLLLFFTGVTRTASDIAIEQIQSHVKGDKDKETHAMQSLVNDGLSVLKGNCDIAEFGNLLHESWQIKRTLSKSISPQFVDDIYEKARNAGVIGGKLLGAGGGGFMLFFARPDDHAKILDELRDFLHVPFKFEYEGSKIIYGI